MVKLYYDSLTGLGIEKYGSIDDLPEPNITVPDEFKNHKATDLKVVNGVIISKPSNYYDTTGSEFVFNKERWLEEFVRPERNRLLSETDFTQLPDCPLSLDKKQELAEYRQQLRDLTETIAADNPVFPIKPIF